MTNIVGYKCPNCGANVPFDSSAQKLKCPYCETEYEIETLESLQAEENVLADEYGWDELNDETISQEGQVTYTCPSCGGEVVGDETMSASCCPYCGNSVIIKKQFEGMLKPDLVIPFKKSKDEAKRAFEDFLKGKRLLPRDFKTAGTVEKLQGMYVPYWLFDCDSSCSARYRATKSRVFRQGDLQITETSHYLVYRDGSISFEKVPVDASSKLTPELMESLEPFDYSDAVDFNTAYLSGFFSDVYDENIEECITRVNQRIKNSTISSMNSTLGSYTTVSTEKCNMRFVHGKIRYALLPIYIFSARYKDKIYTFAMNGQNGRFTGDLPEDRNLVWSYMLSVFAVVFVLMTLFMALVVM